MNSIRDVARAIKYMPDRLLHPLRRRRAQLRVASLGCPGRVVFICLGNINRSPYAAHVFERAARQRGFGDVQVSSAGFIGPGRPASEDARRVASGRGIDMSAHVSRAVATEELTTASLIVVMDAAQQRRIAELVPGVQSRIVVLGDLDPAAVRRRTVADPYGHPVEVFDVVFTRIERCVGQLAASAFGSTR